MTVLTYIGQALYERVETASGIASRHYLASPEGNFGVITRTLAGGVETSSTTYWHKDHLGSVVAEVSRNDDSAAGIKRLNYDAWGKRRLSAGQDGTPPGLGALSSQRGFTGHEMLDEVGLVHMNGRIYDPMSGRFLQADPLIQDPWSTQNYNRYAYILNNPLSLTDPSGYGWWSKWGKTIVAIAAAAIIAPAVSGYLIAQAGAAGGVEVALFASEIVNGAKVVGAAAGGFAAGGIQGGNVESAVFGAFTGAAFSMVGALVPGDAGSLSKVVSHAAVGCGSSAMAGGSCKSGAMSAGFSEFAGPLFPGEGAVFGTTKAAVIGGTASAIGGGKFANGATTASFGYLFNFLAHANRLPDGTYRYDVSFVGGPEEGFSQQYGPVAAKLLLGSGMRSVLRLFDAIDAIPGMGSGGFGTKDLQGATFDETLRVRRDAYRLDPQLASTFSELGYAQSRFGATLSADQFRTFLDTAGARHTWFNTLYGSTDSILEMTNSRSRGW